ncbi:hypothetical protein H2200_001087 [Cladophialophora chaetospira]|uniref:Uncharacterized protein n=1 Tax=Cladophialophora chaetospira TaxID=386627 RepID=A0AA38XL61_9EURO|nr:hypothetical protein H2200_001087 [Cladophialophora chaetospira]
MTPIAYWRCLWFVTKDQGAMRFSGACPRSTATIPQFMRPNTATPAPATTQYIAYRFMARDDVCRTLDLRSFNLDIQIMVLVTPEGFTIPQPDGRLSECCVSLGPEMVALLGLKTVAVNGGAT